MRSIEVNGVTLAVDDRGDGDPVVLLHGFPELAYSWRHQVPALVDAGFRVISFDQRGYGTSAKPAAVADYSLEMLVGDVIGVLDRLGIDEATVVGHDWGSIVAWTAAVTHPDRVTRVVSLNVPYRGACFGFPTTQVITEQLADRFGYVLMFQQEGAAEAGFAADPEGWLMAFYAGGARGRTYMTDTEFATYTDAFKAGGISGPVNWYRNIDANAAALESTLDATIAQPTLMIAADNDPVLPLSLTDGMERWIPDLDVVVIEDSGHWTQQEQPEAVNVALIDWLTRTT
ncbi:MAG: alpha/beta hydrolase [Actinomycetia bacterium]|nr:alpha/beta hydrolase [Actinomycetes bacterium]